MKRYRVLSFVLAFVTGISLASCGGNGAKKGESSLCSWFDDIGFTEKLSQEEYIELLDGWFLDGRPLTSVAPYAFFENVYGSGCSGSCSSFSYGRESSVGDEEVTVSYLSFSTAIEGFSLPYGIELGDSFSSVISSFGYPERASFAGSGEAAIYLTDSAEEQLLLRNLAILNGETEYLNPYQLAYTELYTVTGSNGKKITVERSLDLYFSKGTDPALSMVRIYLCENV